MVSDGSGKEDGGMEDDYDDDGGDEESSGVHSNDVHNVPDAYGRVLVNVAHPPDEPDIFLPEHLASVVKPHQVSESLLSPLLPSFLLNLLLFPLYTSLSSLSSSPSIHFLFYFFWFLFLFFINFFPFSLTAFLSTSNVHGK